MSDPTTLQELADSLAVSANSGMYNDTANPAFAAGYRNALLDTRATVLAMIANVNQRIAANNQVIPESANALSAQALLDGRIEAYEDVRGEAQPECAECGRNDVVGQVGSLYYCTRHEAKVTAQANEADEDDNPEGQHLLHRASPDPDYRYLCIHCGEVLKQVPGGHGPTWVHSATGMVVG
jgi:hypothetical protein